VAETANCRSGRDSRFKKRRQNRWPGQYRWTLAGNGVGALRKNLLAFIETLIDPKTKSLAIKWDDELVKATLLTKEGVLAHPSFQGGG